MIGVDIPITIRPEACGDEDAIRALTHGAFARKPHSNGSEPELVERLRADGDLSLSLVAEDGERIVGHIAFSPVTIDGAPSRWFGLGPVSVWPDLQRNGIGGALVRRGIADLRERGAHGIVLLGDPDFYGRFGFAREPRLTYPGGPEKYFLALALEGEVPSGTVSYAPAFSSRDKG